jgi:polyisoprenoid-binding protein YceI
MSSMRQVCVIGVVTATALAGVVRAADRVNDKYKVAGAEITVVCPLTVGGSFEAKTKNISGEIAPSPEQPGAIGGALRVDLQTLETGIAIRDRHMRENYLEVEKGPEFAVATFEQIRIDKLEGKTTFTGTLLLHGQRKEISGTADLQQRDGRIRVQAQFPIRVSEFQIPKPSYLGVGVRDEIQVKVTLTVAPTPNLVASATR